MNQYQENGLRRTMERIEINIKPIDTILNCDITIHENGNSKSYTHLIDGEVARAVPPGVFKTYLRDAITSFLGLAIDDYQAKV